MVNLDIPTHDIEIIYNGMLKQDKINVESDSNLEHEEVENGSQEECAFIEARTCLETLKAFACDKGNISGGCV